MEKIDWSLSSFDHEDFYALHGAREVLRVGCPYDITDIISGIAFTLLINSDKYFKQRYLCVVQKSLV